jgi:hypothetical protein
LRIAYERRGTMHWRRPWLVLIQGMSLDRLGWEPVLRKLRRHFRGLGHLLFWEDPDGFAEAVVSFLG